MSISLPKGRTLEVVVRTVTDSTSGRVNPDELVTVVKREMTKAEYDQWERPAFHDAIAAIAEAAS